MRKIWMITKWYPNRDDRQFGVFIQKHARAIGLQNQLTLLYIKSTIQIQEDYEIEETKKDGIDEVIVYFRKNTSVLRLIINPFRYLLALKKGLTIMNRNFPGPDIIHGYILLRTGLISMYLSRKKKIPYVISEQWSGYVTGAYMKKGLIKKWLTKIVIRNAAALTCVSNFLKNGMNELGLKNDNTFIIPNCIEQNHSQIKKTTSKTYILIVADLVDRIKNISAVIKMIASLDPIDFELHIIGKGEDEGALKKLALQKGLLDKCVFFEGLKVNEEVYEYLNKCDFLVMNSRFETFSLICAEAMSCGKPVLATRCGGPNDFVVPLAGILIEPDNEAMLKEKFVEMLNGYSQYDSNKIRQHVERLFSIKTVSESFNTVYEHLA